MRLIVFIYFLTFFLISNVHAKIIFCTSPHVDHTLDIKDNKAIETNPGITILHQSVSYKNNVYILESSPGSGAGKNEKRTWTIDLRKGTGILSIVLDGRKFGPYDDYKCKEK